MSGLAAARGRPRRRRRRSTPARVLDARPRPLARAYDPDARRLRPGARSSRNTPVFELFLRAAPRAPGTRRYLGHGRCTRCARMAAAAASTTSSAAASTATPSTSAGSCRTSRRCSTTTPSSSPLYLAAYQVDRRRRSSPPSRARRSTTSLREMRDPAGGFYSTQDADSEGEEGKFFVWDEREVAQLLGDDDGRDRLPLLGRHRRRQLRAPQHPARHARDRAARQAVPARRRRRARACSPTPRAKLFAAREQRVKPGRDDKILTAWNGLMISAFAKAAEVLDDARYRQRRARRRRLRRARRCSAATGCSAPARTASPS